MVGHKKKTIKSLKMEDLSEFLISFKKDLELVKSNLVIEVPILEKEDIIIENNLLYRVHSLSPHGANAQFLLHKMIPINTLSVYLSLDGVHCHISTSGFYYKLVQKAFTLFFNEDPNFDTKILDLLNEFIESYRTNTISYSIILPIMGMRAEQKKDSDIEDYIRIDDNCGIQVLKPACVFTSRGTYWVNRRFWGDQYVQRIEIGLVATGSAQISFEKSTAFMYMQDDSPIKKRNPISQKEDKNPPNPSDNPVWIKIKNAMLSLLLAGKNFGFSIPFYDFPWWVQKIFYFKFHRPSWLPGYFNPSTDSIENVTPLVIQDLVPDSELMNLRTMDCSHYIHFKGFNFAENDINFGGGGFWPKKFPDFKSATPLLIPEEIPQIRQMYDLFSDSKSLISFEKNSFLFLTYLKMVFWSTLQETVVQMCTILEYLLVKGNNKIAQKVQTKASLIISKSDKDYEENEEFFKELYNLRSFIVHGKEKYMNATFRKLTNLIFGKALSSMEKIEFEDMVRLRKFLFHKINGVIFQINISGIKSLNQMKSMENLAKYNKKNLEKTNSK